MKIAVPTRQGFVDDHLACCEYFTIYTVDDFFNIVLREDFKPSESGCCIVSPAARLRHHGVDIILAGNIDGPAYTRMMGFGMEVVRNHYGEADRVVKDYLEKLAGCSCMDNKTKQCEDPINN
jgi:predicted Fe-Mo cluster-binding NifX family protein